MFPLASLWLLFSSVFTVYAEASEWKCVLADEVVWCVEVDPAKPVVYTGTSANGLYKTKDRGASWVQLNKGFAPFPWVYGIAVNPKDPDIMYTGVAGGIYKSTDAGSFWEEVRGGVNIYAVAIDPGDDRIVYAGVYKSTDGGNIWRKMSIIGRFGNTSDFAIDQKHPEVIYAINGYNIFKSTDSGETWELIPKGIRCQVAIDPVQTDTVYASGRDGVCKSIDAGETWELMGRGLPKGPFVTARPVLIDPVDHRIVYTGINGDIGRDGLGVFLSKDGGETWEQLGKGFPVGAVCYDLAITPSDPNVLYAATVDGLWSLELEPRESHSVQPFGRLATTWGKIRDF